MLLPKYIYILKSKYCVFDKTNSHLGNPWRRSCVQSPHPQLHSPENSHCGIWGEASVASPSQTTWGVRWVHSTVRRTEVYLGHKDLRDTHQGRKKNNTQLSVKSNRKWSSQAFTSLIFQIWANVLFLCYIFKSVAV